MFEAFGALVNRRKTDKKEDAHPPEQQDKPAENNKTIDK